MHHLYPSFGDQKKLFKIFLLILPDVKEKSNLSLAVCIKINRTFCEVDWFGVMLKNEQCL